MLLKKRSKANKNKNAEIHCLSQPFLISEKQKNELVVQLYDFVKDISYFRTFYDTLEVLDAGYMSERKQEALELFREIYNVPAIPTNYIDNGEFIHSCEEFLNSDNKEFNYTRFKAIVLSKYVVNIDIRRYIVGNAINLENASNLIYKIAFKNESEIKKLEKLKRWLNDIYMLHNEYDKEQGLIKS